ncbi:membrane protein [Novosphingobium marinum]|uniref:Outer membrane scaffolding protein for murein synthesis (MipA/OmpV family) n=1 Tax=Novosphingobium marinum TaxID=1514948 RepID=A0A7Z0BTI1_9SPHN|nr:MipA/OmpV family protein [Novosphingobium marinum]NYH96036.1 outer membrane scaffolding protein for murein synthesis (MipA/OmpV family) [Novosphingobium marinum]GGC31912.1 membrane protein [Novosphingobium marinum]
MRFAHSFATAAAVAAFSALVTAAPAQAQTRGTIDGAVEENIFDGDHITIGAGVLYNPSYDGSDDYVVTPIPLIQGKLAGIEITPRAGGIALDFVPDPDDAKVTFSLGPVASYSANRKNQIEDPVVRSAGKLKAAIELGVSAGVTIDRLFHQYDSLSFAVDTKWDVNGAHGGMVVSPGVTYVTPLNRATLVTIGVSTKYVDDDYADYYFSVSPEQSAASGLPLYRADGGFESVGVNVFGGYDLNGNILDGGFAIFVLGSYSRMLGDAKETPYTSVRGSANQWVAGAGLGYTF